MRLMFVGDVCLGEHYFSFGHGVRSALGQLFNSDMSEVSAYLHDADYVVANLEGPVSRIPFKKNDFSDRVFRGDINGVKALKELNINVACVANNHSLQHGPLVFSDCVDLLVENKIAVVGLSDEAPLIFNDGEVSVAIISVSDIEDPFDSDNSIYEVYNEERIIKKIKSVRSKVDHVILLLHWGVEGTTEITDRQKNIKKVMFDAGCDFVIGHHSHVVSHIERCGDQLFAPSLGNFVFDLPWEDRYRKSGILDIELSKSGIERALFSKCILDRRGLPTRFLQESIVLSDGRNEIYGFFKSNLFNQFKKYMYFFGHLGFGDRHAKFRFLRWKIISWIAKMK
ncbi:MULTISPECIES: CapA family protein [Marinobacter]|uniref:CapA family protein n=1 Tax=Marinobacter TaxID=2742 RepID=UPI00241DB460|nr:CapA family protein [Marinobacter nauticus]|tara:strand:- start:1794 stop:2813 length:1020 start_codon:yes stop_codon:yes gene_type:complete